MRRLLISCALVSVLACGFSGVDEQSSESTTTSTASSNDADVDTTADTSLPDLGTGLPEGCGDGVVTPGQYCYLPVIVTGLQSATSAFGADFDGDGVDELFLFDYFGRSLVQFAYENGRFVEVGRSELGALHEWSTAFDFDGDGTRDILALWAGSPGTGTFSWHRNDGGVIGPRILDELLESDPWVPPLNLVGIPAAIDLDGDAYPEFLASTYLRGEVNGGLYDGPAWRAQIWRRQADAFVQDGPVEEGFPLPGCGHLHQNQRADLDGDGVEELIVIDDGQVCDPYPLEYDPEWHRFLVFRADPSSGTLELAHSVPVGGRTDIPTRGRAMWALDINADEHVDVAVQTYEGLAIHLGRGDGSFDSPVLGPVGVFAFGEFDGDAQIELLLDGSHQGRSAQEVMIADAWPLGGPAVSVYAPGPYVGLAAIDLNGDALDDIVIEDRIELFKIPTVLLSQP